MGMSSLTKSAEEFDSYADESGVIGLMAEYSEARVLIQPSGTVELWEPMRPSPDKPLEWEMTTACSAALAKRLVNQTAEPEA